MNIGIIGLGYVGLPLACLMATKYNVVGYDVDEEKIDLLDNEIDYTGDLRPGILLQETLNFTTDINALSECNVLIVAVPTDIDEQNKPNFEPLESVCIAISSILTPGMIVVFESTVYPGLTEELCIPILEMGSRLQWKKDFNVGYSPERINPGDKSRPIQKILKLVAGDTVHTLAILTELYNSVIEAGVYPVSSIKVAEAAKVIENAQRDLNIAFMNELALIFDRMHLDTREVLAAAATKWNFINFEPGLVGGHCIGVDPYYLTYKAEQLGYTPQVIHSGRHLNNAMGKFVAEKVLKVMIKQGKVISDCRVLILGCSFKENVGDIRNSKVFDIARELGEYQITVDFVDPFRDQMDTFMIARHAIASEILEDNRYDAFILAVKHDAFKKYTPEQFLDLSVSRQLNVFDIKGFFNRGEWSLEATHYWRL